MTIAEDKYNSLRLGTGRLGRDIRGHLPTIRKYADHCNYCVEMGVRRVVSTWSFLASKCKKVTSIDITPISEESLSLLNSAAKEKDIKFEFVLGDTTKIEIEFCDLLFIDTLHNFSQLSKELALHGNKARKYLMFHDTTTFGQRDETGSGVGLQPAIDTFLEENNHWSIEEVFTHDNGLTILKRNNI